MYANKQMSKVSKQYKPWPSDANKESETNGDL